MLTKDSDRMTNGEDPDQTVLVCGMPALSSLNVNILHVSLPQNVNFSTKRGLLIRVE